MASNSTSLMFLVTVTPGLERWLAEELEQLGVSGRLLRGGLEARGSLKHLWAVTLWSRLAESVRVRLKPFVATGFAELERGLARLPWHAYLRAHADPKISVACKKSRLYHSGAVTERTLRVIAEQRGPAYPGQGCPTVFVRIERDIVQVSVDASGERLHRRGYRTHIGEAPLRETLAAALVRVAETACHSRSGTATESAHLWDPFCGSAAIALEWLAMRAHEPSGAHRRFAFEQWPIHEPSLYAEWMEFELAKPKPLTTAPPLAYGSDASAKVLRAAKHNAQAAGLADACRLIHADFEEAAAQIPVGALIVTNPPYGVRLSRIGLEKSYARFERLLSARTDLRPVVVACGFAPYLERSGLNWRKVADIKVGGLPVQLVVLG